MVAIPSCWASLLFLPRPATTREDDIGADELVMPRRITALQQDTVAADTIRNLPTEDANMI